MICKFKEGVTIMADLNEIIDKAKDLAQTAGEKSQDIYQISKLKVEITQLNMKLDKNYGSIGKKVYNSIKEGNEMPDFAASIEEIDLLKADIEEKKDLISAIKNAIRCPSCGADVNEDDPFCPKCGSQIK